MEALNNNWVIGGAILLVLLIIFFAIKPKGVWEKIITALFALYNFLVASISPLVFHRSDSIDLIRKEIQMQEQYLLKKQRKLQEEQQKMQEKLQKLETRKRECQIILQGLHESELKLRDLKREP